MADRFRSRYPQGPSWSSRNTDAISWNDTAAEGRWRHKIGVADAAIFPAQGDEKKPRQKPGLAEGVRAKL